ncbi:MAG: hypothetical protein AB1401_00415 [Thermodesulfobacteriota bacterium]
MKESIDRKSIDTEIKKLINQSNDLERQWKETAVVERKREIQREIDRIDRKIDRLKQKKMDEEKNAKRELENNELDDELVEYEPGKFIKRREYDWLME